MDGRQILGDKDLSVFFFLGLKVGLFFFGIHKNRVARHSCKPCEKSRILNFSNLNFPQKMGSKKPDLSFPKTLAAGLSGKKIQNAMAQNLEGLAEWLKPSNLKLVHL